MKSQIFFLISIVVLGGRVDAHTETVKNAVADPGETKVGDANFHLLVDIMSVMEKGVKGLIKEIDEQKHPQKGSIIAELQDRIDRLEELAEDEPETIYCRVQFEGGAHSISPGHRVKFTDVAANIGDAFDTTQGYFVAPVEGTYLFSTNLCVSSNNWIVFGIVQDDISLKEQLVGDERWHQCESATTVTYMTRDSKVWVEVTKVHGGQLNSEFGISSFTAVFLNNFKKP